MQARAAVKVLAHYDAAGTGRRTRSWKAVGDDADAAARRRDRIAYVSRDMIRNTPFAGRAQQVIVNNTIGDGIIPSVHGRSERLRIRGLQLIQSHFDTTDIDARGLQNLYGLQRLVMSSVVESGECLVIRRRRPAAGLTLPFQIEVLEPDFLDTSREGTGENGGLIKEGIEYDAEMRRVAYWIFPDHPGTMGFRALRTVRHLSVRVPADDVLHIFRQDRPGQMRGVSWFAPIALLMQDLGDHQDAQLMRQKIAACFAAFRTTLDTDIGPNASPFDVGSKLSPGAIQTLAPGEDIRFADPPTVGNFDEFTRVVLRSIAAGMGVSYEALVGDLSNVNFSSARMGRMEMDRNISSWQWLMLMPQMMHPIGRWFVEAWSMVETLPAAAPTLHWTPPRRVLVDPTKELPAMGEAVRLGFQSRQSIIRSLGYDPEEVADEIEADNQDADARGFVFESDGRHTAAKQQVQETENAE